MQGNEIEEEVTEMKAWQDKIRSVVPYTPGEQPNRPNMIKLNTNENPYPPAPGVRDVLDHFDEDRLRLYPDPTAGTLVGALADYYHVGKDQVFTGVGSDDVLAIAFMTFFNSDKPIFFPDITYSFYPVWADLFKVPYETKPLKEDFSICPQDYYPANGGVIFPNPNAPTSHYEDLSVIREILDHNQDVIVIVDEAYIDFAGESALSLLDDYENLLIVQTFSKSRSMAGMRIGYAIGHPELIKAMNDVKYSFNSYTMSQTALTLGVEAVRDDATSKHAPRRSEQPGKKPNRHLQTLDLLIRNRVPTSFSSLIRTIWPKNSLQPFAKKISMSATSINRASTITCESPLELMNRWKHYLRS